MSPMISELLAAGCSLALFVALAATLEWRLRRFTVARRVARGLRSYATGVR